MGSQEIAVLEGIYANYNSSNLISWLELMSDSFVDIVFGIGESNRDIDASYHRMKIAHALFAKAVVSHNELFASDPSFHQMLQAYDSCLPTLNWKEFFTAISFLGLGPEFASIISGLKSAIQNYVYDRLSDWLKLISEDSTKLDMLACMVFLASVVITSSILRLADCNSLKRCLEKGFHTLLKKLEMSDFIFEITTSSMKCIYCLKLMLQKLEFDISLNVKSAFAAEIQNPDIFNLVKLSNISSIAKDRSMMGMKKHIPSQSLKYGSKNLTEPLNRHCSISSDILPKPLFSSVQKCFESFNRKSNMPLVKLICQTLNKFLDHISGGIRASQEKSTSIAVKHDSKNSPLFTIAHCLEGFEESTVILLTEMAENPTKDDSWKNAFVCLNSSPESLALKANLMIVLDGIANCISFSEHEHSKRSEMIHVALQFQELFWRGFELMPLVSKLEVTKDILCSEVKSSLISEYPLKHHELDVKRIHAFEQKQRKSIRLFFDGIIKQKTLSNLDREKFCAVCLMSVFCTLDSFIDKVLSNQQDLLCDLLIEWDYILTIPPRENFSTTFWTKFLSCMIDDSKKGDGKSANNGLRFLEELLERFSACESTYHSHRFVNQIFQSVATEISKGPSVDVTNAKLFLKILNLITQSKLFCTSITVEQSLTLCGALGAKIDMATAVWRRECNYDEEEDDLLFETFDALLHITEGELTLLKKDNLQYFTSLINWFSHVVKPFQWMTQILCLPVLQLLNKPKIPVPACLSEVCEIPDILEPCEELSYGVGTGLLAWHQCFVYNSSLCPLYSLDIDSLQLKDVKLFSNGWIISLAQVLPFCRTQQWITLMEATMILIRELKIHVPYRCNDVASLPAIDMEEVFTLLSMVQIFKNIFDILCRGDCIDWGSHVSFAYVIKCFSTSISWLIYDSADFGKAELRSQIFILSRVFCSVCSISGLVQTIDGHSSGCVDNLFVLGLDILGSFEKILIKIADKNENPDREDEADISESSTDSLCPADSLDVDYQPCVLELSSRIDEMIASASFVNQGQCKILMQKLSSLDKAIHDL